jgi:hypothetical protein
MLGGQSDQSFSWLGTLDEIRLWNRALSEAEITERHTRALPDVAANLVGRWGFEEGVGLTAASTAADGHHAWFDAEPELRPEWEISTAPIAGPGAAVTGGQASGFFLPGQDPEGSAITARVLMLPLHGRLFQTADGATPTVEISSVPVAVTNSERRIVYLSDNGFSGTDAFRYEISDGALTSLPAAFRLTVVPAGAGALPPMSFPDPAIAPPGAGAASSEQLLAWLVTGNPKISGELRNPVRVESMDPATGTIALRWNRRAGGKGPEPLTVRWRNVVGALEFSTDAISWSEEIEGAVITSTGVVSTGPGTETSRLRIQFAGAMPKTLLVRLRARLEP